MTLNQAAAPSPLNYVNRVLMECALCLTILLVLTAIALTYYTGYLSKTKTTEAWMFARDYFVDANQYLEKKGHWPAPTSFNPDMPLLASGEFDGEGGLHLTFSAEAKDLEGYTLTFRASHQLDKGLRTFILLCGHAEPTQGFSVSAKNFTTVPRLFLTHQCR